MNISCIIIEDEPLAQERIKGYIPRLPHLSLQAVFDNAVDALVYLKSNKTDLIFLDINLGTLSGIQFLEIADFSSKVIITTAYHEYALKGYELNVTDYLLKPFTFERFSQAVEKAADALQVQRPVATPHFIFIKTEYRLEKVLISDICFIEGVRDYRRIHTLHKKIMTLQTFGQLEQELPPHLICRVHKSYMVALDKIETIEGDRIRIGQTVIPVSETYRKSFLEKINRATR
ncbi:LytR/AlgR family response regulator transcription factor [Taibaiella chishuiensis]|uniref:LytTR family two component transcriptional regulator n=1 Tax=Taibaiella chishuiensis TaxID=1434707 RepID=A0A2P8CR06_9BACT|nr:LytTR family DNA-binding domain-containing protein [Taibaiella chishuiensis]PSK87405.1 LytTR family two component transcriptional regulator [Taibaiella chishuiensis]